VAVRREIIGVGEYGVVFRGRPGPVEAWRMVEAPIPPDMLRVGTAEEARLVSKTEFESFSPSEQAYLKKHGVEKFNIEQEKTHAQKVEAYEEAKSFFEREETKQKQWYKENIIEVGPEKESIYRTAFEKMSPEDQVLLKKVGIKQFNIEISKPLSGREMFDKLIAEGSLRPDAVYKSYDTKTGQIEYEVPTPPITGRQVFNQLVADGTIPKGSVYKSYNEATGEVSYETTPPVVSAPLITPPTIVVPSVKQISQQMGLPSLATDIHVDMDTGEVTYNLVNPVTYLRDNRGDVQGLIAQGHSAATANKVQNAVEATWDFWNIDGSLQDDKFLRLNPDKEKVLTDLGYPDARIEEVKEYNAQPLSKEAFTRQYFADRGWPWEAPFIRVITDIPGLLSPAAWRKRTLEAQRYGEAARAYIAHYGAAEYYRSLGVQVASMPLPALRALYPEVTLADISAVEWAFTALVPVSLLTGGAAGVAGA